MRDVPEGSVWAEGMHAGRDLGCMLRVGKAAGAFGFEEESLVCEDAGESCSGGVLTETYLHPQPIQICSLQSVLLCSALLQAPSHSCLALPPQAIKSLLLRTWVPPWTNSMQLISLTMRSGSWMDSLC